jgi:hypothetical protein
MPKIEIHSTLGIWFLSLTATQSWTSFPKEIAASFIPSQSWNYKFKSSREVVNKMYFFPSICNLIFRTSILIFAETSPACGCPLFLLMVDNQ